MTELILIRHGETDWNVQGRFQGQIDVPLNAMGLRQAALMAERMARERVDVFYCSDLLRTRQTAAPAAARLALGAVPDAALREQHFGVLEGLSFDEVKARHPDELAAWLRHDPDYALPGGESVRSFHARVLAAVRVLAAQHAGLRLAIVTHGGVLDMIYRTVHALPLVGPRTCPIPNAGLNRLRLRSDALEIVSWADDAHLAPLMR
ncbi:MAG: histidine phosphatase family protein [Ideonella sp.]|nr:histidine phosphatase family protein [Ideonella sp.]MBP6778445.1 histidine phosphatase family protein [Piscinibacter sp.]